MKMTFWPVAALVIATAAFGQEAPGKSSWDVIRERYDANHDGKVSLDEYPRGEAVFRRLDRDGDGSLTERDLVSRPGLFGARRPDGAAPETRKSAPEAAVSPVPAMPSDEQVKFFETKIRPVLADRCYSCHSSRAKELRGKLRLDTREGVLEGGATGPAIIPGDPDASLLVQAVRYERFQMPPKSKLPASTIQDFETWVKMGAPDPRTDASSATPAPAAKADAKYDPAWKRNIDLAAGRQFWSFQPPVMPTAPVVKAQSWAASDLDRFVLAGMEEHGLKPVKDADRRTWIRRVTFDLIGLPPAPEEVEAFERDRSTDAFEKVVDRLLASPRFGERWGRHWLDVARFAESSGKESNILYPQAWRYRDWVIASFNQDKPYDLFLKEQLAGDLMPTTDVTSKAERQIATGFLALGTKGHNTRNRQQFVMDVVDEQIDATSEAMLGLTVACARCHDHKFDPIPTEDYYALAGIFLSSETRYGTYRTNGNLHPSTLIELPAEAKIPDGPAMAPGERAALERFLDRAKSAGDDAGPPARPGAGKAGKGAKPDAAAKEGKPDASKPDVATDVVNRVRVRFAAEQAAMLGSLLARFDTNGNALPENRLAMGVQESKRPRNARVLVRGDVEKQGDVVPRGFVQVISGSNLPKISQGSGRLELAAWVASPDNPLTARVMVNRIWLHLFGRGIVATPDNFGKNGVAPTHPELLDWLARTFVEDGWSVKKMVRRMVLSHTYRLSSDYDAHAADIDPEDTWHWRMPKRRLEGEAIRDAMLSIAGSLDLTPPVGSPIGTLEGPARAEQLLRFVLAERPVRSVYLPIMRDRVPEALEVFDFAEPSFVIGDREKTNVATQALYLMNSPEVMKQADAMATRVTRAANSDDQRIIWAFMLAFGRRPSGSEYDAAHTFLADFPATMRQDGAVKGRRGAAAAARNAVDPHQAAWAAFCQALFQSAEFRYID